MYERNKAEYNRITEKHIDKAIRDRIGEHLCVYHITGIGRKINGVTVVTRKKGIYFELLEMVTDFAWKADALDGDAYPGELKAYLRKCFTGVAVCDSRDEFSRIEGRVRAKRNWLEAR